MYKNSKNHHYIPKLYLSGFVNDIGKLKVYDKLYSNFLKDKQTPRTSFFTKDLNTTIFNGVKTDQIEKLYGKVESPFGEFFNLLRSEASNNDLITSEGVYLIKLFISVQFCRLPIFDEYLENYINNLDLSHYGNCLEFNGINLGTNDEVYNLLASNPCYRKSFKCFVLPILMFDLSPKEDELKHWKYFKVSDDEKGWANILISDNPLLIEDFANLFNFQTKLILPLSKSQFIVFSPNSKNINVLSPLFSTQLAMLTYAQSERYVAGTSREFMEEVIRLFYKVYGVKNINLLKKELFLSL